MPGFSSSSAAAESDIVKGVGICFLNIRSVYNKMGHLLHYINTNNIVIAAVAETWLHHDIKTSELFVKNYRIYRLDRADKAGGGVAFLVKNNVHSEVCNTLLTTDIECLQVSVKVGLAKTMQIIVIYRPPSGNIENFIVSFANLLNNIDYVECPTVIVGDFNIDLKKRTPAVKGFRNFLKNYNLCVRNDEPTRKTTTTSTLIDLVITNEVDENDKQNFHHPGFI